MTEPRGTWDRYAIKAEVERRGLTLTGIARSAGLHEGACRQGLIGNSRAGAEAVADALGLPFRELFPTLYRRGRHNEVQSNRTRSAGDSAKAPVRPDMERRSA